MDLEFLTLVFFEFFYAEEDSKGIIFGVNIVFFKNEIMSHFNVGVSIKSWFALMLKFLPLSSFHWGTSFWIKGSIHLKSKSLSQMQSSKYIFYVFQCAALSGQQAWTEKSHEKIIITILLKNVILKKKLALRCFNTFLRPFLRPFLYEIT